MADRAKRATLDQQHEIGRLICRFGSCKAEYGYYGDGWVYLHLEQDENKVSYYIEPDGDIHKDAPFSPGEKR